MRKLKHLFVILHSETPVYKDSTIPTTSIHISTACYCTNIQISSRTCPTVATACLWLYPNLTFRYNHHVIPQSFLFLQEMIIVNPCVLKRVNFIITYSLLLCMVISPVNVKTETGTGRCMMMIITLLVDPSPHLLAMIGTTGHIVGLQVPRVTTEAHPGLTLTDHIAILQARWEMEGAHQGPIPTGTMLAASPLLVSRCSLFSYWLCRRWCVGCAQSHFTPVNMWRQ